MAARSRRQRLDVGTIDGHDFVPVAGEQDEGRVDDVGHSCRAEQSPGSSTEGFIKCDDVDAAQCLGQASRSRQCPTVTFCVRVIGRVRFASYIALSAAASSAAPLYPTVRVSAMPMLAGQVTVVVAEMLIGADSPWSRRLVRLCELGSFG